MVKPVRSGRRELHEVPLKEFYRLISTTRIGITDIEAEARRRKYGRNVFSEPPKPSLLMRFLSQFRNLFSILLLIGAFLGFLGELMAPGQGSLYVGIALLGVTLLNALFTFLQEYKAEKAMEAFRNLLPSMITVVRNGVEKEVPTAELVPGDVILLHEGDKIPADARIIEASLLKVDHSALTGESEPQLRSVLATNRASLKSRNMVFSGTLVQSGSGRAAVTATGDATEMGRIATMTHTVKEETSKIRKELAHFVRVISYIAIALGVLFFLIGFAIGRSFWENLVFAIGIIVANVPEGLLPTVTLTLALAAKRMAKKNALVKDMEAIETLGSVTVICTDKTGTLTANSMAVESLSLDGRSCSVWNGRLFVGRKEMPQAALPSYARLSAAMVLCNNAHYLEGEEKPKGDPTETALLSFAGGPAGVTGLRKAHARLEEIPFESDKKYMITANAWNKGSCAFLKGAPERVLAKCTHIGERGRARRLTPQERRTLLAKNRVAAKDGLRVLAFACRDLNGRKPSERLLEEDRYTYLGLVAMRDPPRVEVPEAVRLCREAGIRIVVISGDQADTVAAIARSVGIAKDPLVLTSEAIARMSDTELREKLAAPEVIVARAMPVDKLRIVSMLQQAGVIVAVTGDGVNDAPALKRADVGVAMGKSGTEVAKEASNIVLMDDNFATIVNAIKEGRTIYDSIKSFIIYILTSNTPEIIPFLLFVLFSWPLALPALLILAIDLGTDMLPAIGLGVEPSEQDIMRRPPRDAKAKLLSWRMIARSYGLIGPFQTLVAYLIFFAVLTRGGWVFGFPIGMTDPLYRSAVTAFFSTVVVTQIFNVLACRTIRTSSFTKPLTNRLMLAGIAVEILLLSGIVFLPVFHLVLGTAPFPLDLVPYMMLGGVGLFLIEEGRKYLSRRFGWFEVY